LKEKLRGELESAESQNSANTELTELLARAEQSSADQLEELRQRGDAQAEALRKERTELYAVQVELKASLQQLEVANHVLEARAEEAAAKVKRVREGTLVAQMVRSPLLEQLGPGPGDEDGWGSPAPRPEVASDGWGAGQADAGAGWAGWEEQEAPPPAFAAGPRNEAGEREADLEDGWGDDSWGGFAGQDAEPGGALAANLRWGAACPPAAS
jgi:hypothetical protein